MEIGSDFLGFPLRLGDWDRIEVQLRGTWLPTMEGKNDAMLLSEVCENVLKTKPEYSEDTAEAASKGFKVTVTLNGKAFSSGVAGTKKQARQNAAGKALATLLPEVCPDPSLEALPGLPHLDFFLITTPPSQLPEGLLPHPVTEILDLFLESGMILGTPATQGSEEAAHNTLTEAFPELRVWGQLTRLLHSTSGATGSPCTSCPPPPFAVVPSTSVAPSVQKVTRPPGIGASKPSPTQRTPAELAKDSRPHKPNHALLERLKQEMKKLA